ncbi:MAG: hypothetical protein OSB43_15395 [Nocardioides sp.]|uniref:hypothetical protein n=1 Tax=Nocardioides sp. TaxID=35761 RepID=UPI00239CC429|nr:hypothetical protein [Nocardioides sp.]MDE0777660.1 hypothetical protein [Nocardioides sp.]
MRRTLGSILAPVLLCSVLAGCGGDADVLSDGAASDPAPTETPTSTQTDGDAEEPVDYVVVGLPSETAAGGSVSPMLTPVRTPDELDTFVSQFRLDSFADEVRDDATSATDEGDLWAAVVSIGCDVPPGVIVEEGEAGYLVTPEKVAAPLQECLAPVTTVALVAIS